MLDVLDRIAPRSADSSLVIGNKTRQSIKGGPMAIRRRCRDRVGPAAMSGPSVFDVTCPWRTQSDSGENRFRRTHGWSLASSGTIESMEEARHWKRLFIGEITANVTRESVTGQAGGVGDAAVVTASRPTPTTRARSRSQRCTK